MTEAQMLRQIEMTNPSGCWMWTASTTQGYGSVRHNGRGCKAHRVLYEHLVGPIPSGLELDHLCREPLCVNPDHLEPVTHAENMRRGTGNPHRRTHCKRGHPFDEANTYIRRDIGVQVCRACHRERQSRYYQEAKI